MAGGVGAPDIVSNLFWKKARCHLDSPDPWGVESSRGCTDSEPTLKRP